MRTLPLVGLALLNLALFGVAGVFSSIVTKAAGNETLIRSPNCGYINLTDPGSFKATAAFGFMDTNDTLTAAVYQKACYEDAENTLQCGHFVQRKLYWTSNQNAPCSFTSEMCLLGDMTAYAMDTGRIDSHNGLGINAPKEDRIQYRRVTTCSPIQTKDYMTEVNDTDINSPTFGDTLARYFYGNRGNFSYTYQYNEHSLREDYGYRLM